MLYHHQGSRSRRSLPPKPLAIAVASLAALLRPYIGNRSRGAYVGRILSLKQGTTQGLRHSQSIVLDRVAYCVQALKQALLVSQTLDQL